MSWKKELITRGRNDPVWWIETVLGDTLWGKQREICESVAGHNRIAIPASFGVGKTFLIARLALWWLYTHKPAKVVSTAPTSRQVKDLLWSEIRTAHAKAKFPLGGNPLTLTLNLAPDQFAVGFSTDDMNMDMFTGYHSPNMLVLFDQAGGIMPGIWKAAEGLMTSANCKWIATSNTAISDGAFADICMPDRETPHGDWKVIPISAEMSPNIVAGKNIFPGIISVEWLAEKKRQWDEDDPLYRIFVKAEFVPNSQMNLIPYHRLMSSITRDGEINQDEGIDIGLDVARQGVDSTVWCARSGSKALAIKRVTGNDLMRTVDETIEFKLAMEQRFGMRVRFIKVDVIGIGAGVYDRLLELDEPVLAVNNAEAAVEPEKYSNTRAEMGWSIRSRFERDEVGFAFLKAEEPDLFALFKTDAGSIKYKITQNGRIILWSKEEIKKELGRSPDYWDSVVMAFEDPKGGVPSIEFVAGRTGNDTTKAVSDEMWQEFLGKRIPYEADMVEHEI